MSELTVVATATAKAGEGDALEKLLRASVVPTHGEEGNLHFSLHRSVQQPEVIVGIERWASQEALDVHFATPHIQKVMAEATDLMAGPPVVQVLTWLPEGDSPKGRF